MQEVYIQNDSMWFVIKDEAGLYKAMRMQIFLYKNCAKHLNFIRNARTWLTRKIRY